MRRLALRGIGLAIKATPVVAAVLFLWYYLPGYDVVRIADINVVRQDVKEGFATNEGVPESGGAEESGPDASNPVDPSPRREPRIRTRDVRLIYAVWPDGSPRVFRNEDTGWGFPWYFKFDSDNVQAKATDLKSTYENPRWVVVQHYGWRIQMLSMYPNAMSVEQVSGPGHWPIPWFNIAFFAGMGAAAFFVWRAWRRFVENKVQPAWEEITGVADGAGDTAGKAADSVLLKVARVWVRLQMWLDTWRPKEKRRYSR